MNERRRERGPRGRLALGALLAAAPMAAYIAPGALGCAPADPVDFEAADSADLHLAELLGVAELERHLEGSAIDVRRDLVVSRVLIDDLSMAHTRVQQLHAGVPVLGGEAIVHLQRDGSLFAVTDALVRDLAPDLPAAPAFDADEAIDLALAGYDCPTCLTAPPAADLWILRLQRGDHLAYRVELSREDGTDRTSMPVLFLDAITGDKVFEYDNLQTGTGTSLYSGVQTITTTQGTADSRFYLQDLPQQLGTFDASNAAGSAAYGDFIDDDDQWDAPPQQAAVDVHHCVSIVYDYFATIHGRDGIDGAGGPFVATAVDGVTKLVTSRVHYGVRYNNAYWNSITKMMTYGDGDGVMFSPLVTLDVCGHEMMHGVTSATANLIYIGESGALNESFSDVFGAMVERHARGESADTWRLGEECYTPAQPGDALRFMDDPHQAKDRGYTADDDPAHYRERYIGSSDNGGVHINSGIPNHAFYLLAVGQSGGAAGFAGIGAEDAARIWYIALTMYMTSTTNFAGARRATLNAAAEIFGPNSAQRDAVERAWTAVGVGGGCSPGVYRLCCPSRANSASEGSSPSLDEGALCSFGVQRCTTAGLWGPCR